MLIHTSGPLYLLFLCWIVLSQCLKELIPCGHSSLITSSESPSRSTFSKVGFSWSFSIRSKVKVVQLCPALCSPVAYIVHGILQARILEWVAFPFSRGSSQPRDWTQVSHIAGRFFTTASPGKPKATFSSVRFSRSVVSDSLQPHESQHARPSCPSPAPGFHSDSCPSSQWGHPAISASVVPFSSCPQSLPASESFPMSQLFA